MRHIYLILIVFLGLSPCLPAEDPPMSLAESRRLFDATLEERQTEFQEKRDLARLQYAGSLEPLRRQAQEAGDLDTLLFIQREQTQAREGAELQPLPENENASGIQRARARFEADLRAAREEHQRNNQVLRQSYITHLQNMQRHHTRENNIDEALAFREEQRRVEGHASAPPRNHVDAPAQSEAPLFRLRWHRGMPGNQLMMQHGQERSTPQFEHKDGNRTTPRGYHARGGHTTIPDVNQEMITAFKASNEISIVISLETPRLDQLGPARILSLSRDTGTVNFSLGQQENKLVMRLRTPHHMPHGDPQIELATLRTNTPYRLVFTHRPGETRAFLNGEEVDIPNRAGDFRSWDENTAFILADEHTGNRTWHGSIHRFELFNRVLPPETALRFSREP